MNFLFRTNAHTPVTGEQCISEDYIRDASSNYQVNFCNFEKSRLQKISFYLQKRRTNTYIYNEYIYVCIDTYNNNIWFRDSSHCKISPAGQKLILQHSFTIFHFGKGNSSRELISDLIKYQVSNNNLYLNKFFLC